MYLFISTQQKLPKQKKYQQGGDYLIDANLKRLQKRVLEYSRKYSLYPKNEPTGVFVFEKKYGAVVEKYDHNLLGWIIKL